MTKILIIDDEPLVRESIATVLSREGYDVEVAADAETGLARLFEDDFHMLISDIIMPGVDGVQAICQVRQQNPDIKIIAISGGGNFSQMSYKPEAITTTAYLQAATEAGADWVITKPFERQTLLESVRRLLEDA